LDPGTYKITVRKEGFRTMIRFHVPVEAGQSARADFGLLLGSVQETVTVEGTAARVEPEEPAVTTEIGRTEIERIPINGRGVLALVELAPGANTIPATRGDAGQLTADGQRPNTNYFMVDGISANNGVSVGGLPAQATGGTLPVLSAFGSLDA